MHKHRVQYKEIVCTSRIKNVLIHFAAEKKNTNPPDAGIRQERTVRACLMREGNYFAISTPINLYHSLINIAGLLSPSLGIPCLTKEPASLRSLLI